MGRACELSAAGGATTPAPAAPSTGDRRMYPTRLTFACWRRPSPATEGLQLVFGGHSGHTGRGGDDDGVGDVPQLHVLPLGRPAKDVKSAIGVAVGSGHQNALGLLDLAARPNGDVQLVDQLEAPLIGACPGDDDGG